MPRGILYMIVICGMKEEDLEDCETLLEKDHKRNDVVVKKYFSRGGNFITGIDTESEVLS